MVRPQPKERERWKDPIVEEVRKVREELFAAAGYDLDVFCRQLRERPQKEGRHAVTRPPRKPKFEAAKTAPAGTPNKRIQPTRTKRARG